MAELAPGTTLAGYRIDAPAGRGGMGVVVRATQLGLGRPVALKLIAPELASDESFRRRFVRESRLAASIDHPNVIPVYEAGEEDGQLFLAMRWVEGTDLRTLLERHGPLSPARAVFLVGQIAAALDAAHRRGLVHRDVKPANVLVTGDGEEEHAYLTDFGLTRSTGSESGLTRTGQFVGTIDYVAPEQIEGKHADARSDVYALGCLLFHLVTGRVPFPRDSEVAKMYAHLNDEPPVVSQSGTGATPLLDPVISRALAKDPDDRFPSAGDLARAARAVLAGTTPEEPEHIVATGLAAPGATRAAATEPAAPPTAQPATAAAATEALAAPRRSGARRAAPFLLAAIGAAAVVGVVLAVSGGGGGGGGSKTEANPGGPRAPAGTIPNVGQAPDGITVDGNDVWVALSGEGGVRRIDGVGKHVVGDPIPVGANPDTVGASAGTVWVTNTDSNTVQELIEGRAGRTVKVGAAPEGLALGPQFVWVANSKDNSVTRVRRADAKVIGAPTPVGAHPVDVVITPGLVWVTNSGDGTVTRIDVLTAKRLGEVRVDGEPRGIAFGGGSVWVADTEHDRVLRLDPRSGQVKARITVGHQPRELAFGAGSIWVVNTGDGDVTRIDARTGKVRQTELRVGRNPIGVAFGAGAVWVANNRDNSVTRLEP